MKKWGVIYSLTIVCLGIYSFRDAIAEHVFGAYSSNIESVLKLAGENRNELEAVLDHYKLNKEKQKLEASKFLIINCYAGFHKSIEVRDYNGKFVQFDPEKYGGRADILSVKKAKDSIFYSSDVEEKIAYDCKTLNADYLIDHIDRSFVKWKESAWVNKVNFNQFCNYILPYRIGREELSSWHEYFNHRYGGVVDTIKDKSIFNVATALNTAISNDLHYVDIRMTGWDYDKSIPKLFDSGFSLCDDQGVVGVALMRSFGVPATVDFTIWANSDRVHKWAVFLDENGKTWSFGAGEQNPDVHINTLTKKDKKYDKIAKIYRKTFLINEESFMKGIQDMHSIPLLFRQPNILDVTDEYIKTYDVEIKLDEIESEHENLYLCVWNENRWKPIQWGIFNKDKVSFPNVGAGVLYAVGSYEGEINLLTDPFIFTKQEEYIYLNGSDIELDRVFIEKYVGGIGKIINECNYSLSKYIDGSWVYIDEVGFFQGKILLNKLHENTIYRLIEQNEWGRISRPFIVEDNECVFL